jgi:predicted ATPase
MSCVVVENTPTYRSVATSNEKSNSTPISNATIQHECHSPQLPSTTLKLYGRSKEQSILLDAYHRSRNQTSQWNLVIIKGASGTGKTSLVIDSLREELQKTNGTMLRWTSDRQTVLQISPGFNMAMHNWVQDIMTSDESFVQQYQEHLQNSLDNHLISILLRRWPLLAPLFPIVPPTNHYSSHKDEEYRYWKFCPTFMRTAATINFPLLYFLDDFQWMEQSSFRWILDVLSGPPYQGACFVIAYNPNDEVELMERCSPQRKIEELKSKENINIIEVSIDNLDEASMGDWLIDYFETNPKNTETIRNIL